MTIAQFRRYLPRVQLFFVVLHGTYLAQRWKNQRVRRLYHLADKGRGFFVEVGFDKEQNGSMVLRCFSSSGPLADYAQYVQLPKH